MDAKISSSVRGWVIIITMQSKGSSHSTFKWTALIPTTMEELLKTWNEHEWQMSGWRNSSLQIPIIYIYIFIAQWLLLHKMLMCSAESKTTWEEAAETRLLFQGRGVTLPPTAWQANTNFLLWLCGWLAATLQFNSMTEYKQNNYSGQQVHIWRRMFVFNNIIFAYVSCVTIMLILFIDTYLHNCANSILGV